MPAISAPKGTHDVLPADEAAWAWVHSAHMIAARAHGYGAIETPIFEATELFERGIGVGTDVVDKEMWTFPDRGGRSLTLRPEGTPAVLRAVLSAHLDQERRPVRVRYAGPMFRYDQPQAGRYRQFHQVGIECIAETSPHLDVEAVEVAWTFFQSLGLRDVSLQVNTLGDIEDRTRYRSALVSYYTPLREQLCEDCKRRLTINPLRLLDCKRDAGFVAAAPEISASLSPGSREYFETVTSELRSANVPHQVNPRLVRGLDYYAHTTFEFWHSSLQGAQNALGGGGRYDGLAAVLGFPPTPGVGYALGTERVLIAARAEGLLPPGDSTTTIVALPVTPDQVLAAAQLARDLRAAGFVVVFDASDRKLDKRLKNADRHGATICCLIGEDEAAAGTVTLRDLTSRSQTTVPQSDAVAALRASAVPQGVSR